MALLFRCGEGAVCEPCWRLETASFLVGSESDVRQWGPWPAGPVRPSGPCCFGVASAPCVSLGGWKTGQTASFLVRSESDVRQWEPWPAGPVRPSGPCCFAVARAPFVGLVGGWKTASFLVGSESQVRRALGAVARRPGPSFRALLFRCGGRRLWALLAAGRQLVFLSVQKVTLGTGGRGPQARSVPQGPAVSLWRGRRLWALLAAGRQLVFL